MKKTILLFTAIILIVSSGNLLAFPAGFSFYVDTAPNVYGSPDWAPWWTDTKADVAGGTFTNMRSGAYPGTTTMTPYEEIVYSTGDLGRRLHWIYWIPGFSVDDLDDGLLEVKWVIDWMGTDWTYAGGGWAVDSPTTGWSQPSNWEDYSGGVIGSLGFAWWATDNYALPLSTGGSIYDEVDQADIDALANLVLSSQTFARGMVRYRSSLEAEWCETSLEVAVVPEPGTISLLSIGVFGIFVCGRLRKRK